ncbi:hypothetical protein SD77_3360 [Bacillus badius]|uniref:Uncharacterized protein n=1 Tax=Bacillus badius TaxID=1455 RepID=A0ABR5AXT9_BACBA|nr:hypothetical protein SD78_0048 [Bacillus badius]KIL79494.1 hypothetical protein SD77_3360 [Bacillus badius]
MPEQLNVPGILSFVQTLLRPPAAEAIDASNVFFNRILA